MEQSPAWTDYPSDFLAIRPNDTIARPTTTAQLRSSRGFTRSNLLGHAPFRRSWADQMPGLHLAFALDRDGSPRLTLEPVLEQVARRGRDRSCPASRATPSGWRCSRHRPTGHAKPLPTDHAGDNRAAVDPDPELEAQVADLPVRTHSVEHIARAAPAPWRGRGVAPGRRPRPCSSRRWS